MQSTVSDREQLTYNGYDHSQLEFINFIFSLTSYLSALCWNLTQFYVILIRPRKCEEFEIDVKTLACLSSQIDFVSAVFYQSLFSAMIIFNYYLCFYLTKHIHKSLWDNITSILQRETFICHDDWARIEENIANVDL